MLRWLDLQSGTLRLFRAFGIDVELHWSWGVVALIELSTRQSAYASPAWNVAEYLALFAIVLLHEFGHALACRSVGGKAERIVLWPLGGVAYVAPPQRPGATLWSIAAGPLVNLVLAGPLIGALIIARGASPDVHHFLLAIAAIDIGLFVFNMLPIYPLDGGQIVRALLWFAIGRARSLRVASTIGLAGAGLALAAAFAYRAPWFIALAFFGGMRAMNGLAVARALATVDDAPRRAGFSCPSCRVAPPIGAHWRCACGASIDIFESGALCPSCKRRFGVVACPMCFARSPVDAFRVADGAAAQT